MKQTSDGFSLIELLVVIGLILLLAGLSAPYLSNFYQRSTLRSYTNQAVSVLKKAQSYSRDGRQGSRWGVNFISTKIILFKGTDYLHRDQNFDQIFSIDQPVSLSPQQEIVFDNLTGKPVNGINIVFSTSIESKTIIVNSSGSINVN